MFQFPIGAMVESFRMDTFDAIRHAAALGVSGLQMYCTKGENAPENMSARRKADLRAALADNGLVFSAICADLGMGFGDARQNPALVERSQRIMDLALELGSRVVTTHIGVVPQDPTHPRYRVMQDACRALAEYADSVGARFAVETGPEKSATLRAFLDSLESRGVSVNLDPANLVMVSADDPVEAVHNLKDYIVHTHAKDGVMLRPTDPEYIYGVSDIPDYLRGEQFFREVPLGEGNVGFPAYLAALDEIGYRGFLTIEREVGDDPEADIARAVCFLKDIMQTK